MSLVSKLKKIFLLGSGLAALSANAAYAEEDTKDKGQQDEFKLFRADTYASKDVFGLDLELEKEHKGFVYGVHLDTMVIKDSIELTQV